MKILVVGGGIAGSASAYWLNDMGHEVVLVDGAPAIPSGGYLIQLDRTAQSLLTEMGAGAMVDSMSVPAPQVSVRGPRQPRFELRTPGFRLARRSDLVGAVLRHTAERVPLQLGRELVGIEQDADHVTARFRDGGNEDFDLLVGADGLRSTVRRQILGPDDRLVYENGRTNVWIDVPGLSDHGDAAVLTGNEYVAQVFPYPNADRSLVVASTFTGSSRPDVEVLRHGAVALLRQHGPDFAHLADAAVEADAETIRLTRFAQVRAPRWHNGRVVLVGDAAHCVDPLSGLGAHAGLLGAQLLTTQLTRSADLGRGLHRYEREMKPFVKLAQFTTAALVEGTTPHNLRHRISSVASFLKATAHAIPAAVDAWRHRSLTTGVAPAAA
ncbi:FAD-dependent monooxygenase [Gordonia sp. SID5947]|uniref:FAD-dependent oxidoreductase n=1 Tax=Gordonia sp. SID5947 TaxID=2690315 RepID=UPI00136E9771|nr:FAD-dependent monooxygenase [Gordonia sp. SID5947]MYR08007.1 FAD-dependent monooxygenase [Gordonia sp. SID5947]